MGFSEKYDRFETGFIGGILLPFITAGAVFLFTAHGKSLASYLARIVETGIITHSITLCVFPNIFIFLLLIRFDMLRAARGTLAITIIWAIIVFGVKFLL
jgi:hypothetical protein